MTTVTANGDCKTSACEHPCCMCKEEGYLVEGAMQKV